MMRMRDIFAYTRKLNNKTVLVAGNLTDHVASLNLPFEVEDLKLSYTIIKMI